MTFDRDHERHLLLAREIIRNEARALEETAAGLGHEFIEAVELIARCSGQVVTTGVGKSGTVARKIAAMLASTGTPASFLHAGDAVHGDLSGLRKGDVVVLVSHSGETPELSALMPILKRLGLPVIAITNRARSTLALVSNIAIIPSSIAGADPIGLAPTASSVAAVAIGDAIAIAVAQHRGYTPADFEHRPGGALGKLMQSVYGERPAA